MTFSDDTILRVLGIMPGTSVDGPGLRTSIYLAGCAHHCPGCHNPQSWDPEGGTPMTIAAIAEEIDRHGFNVTLTGGDPLFNPGPVAALARKLRRRGYRLWCYTGYRYEDIAGKEAYAPLLEQLDVLVDSPFILAQRDLHLRFRGSRNQRLIDIPRTLASGALTLWSDPDDNIELPSIPTIPG